MKPQLHLVKLTTDDIKSILYAIDVADDEGYGPEEFGRGNWNELREVLEEYIEWDELEIEGFDTVDSEETEAINNENTDSYSNCLIHFEAENEDAIKGVMQRCDDGEMVLVVYNPDDTECHAIDLLNVVGSVDFIRLMKDIDDVLVSFTVLHTPMGNKVREYLEERLTRQKREKVISASIPSGKPVYDDEGKIIGFQLILN